jgi:hypothetical protein
MRRNHHVLVAIRACHGSRCLFTPLDRLAPIMLSLPTRDTAAQARIATPVSHWYRETWLVARAPSNTKFLTQTVRTKPALSESEGMSGLPSPAKT